jgi:uncharacterized membrane protein (DUF4010 family)
MLIVLGIAVGILGGVAGLLHRHEAFQYCIMVATMCFALSAALDAAERRHP